MWKTDARLWLAALALGVSFGLTGCSDRTNDSSRSIVAPNVVASAAGRPKLVMNASVCGRKVAVL